MKKDAAKEIRDDQLRQNCRCPDDSGSCEACLELYQEIDDGYDREPEINEER